jgi:hypothetical protein
MEATEKQPDTPNLIGISVIGAAGALLVFIIFVALQAYYAADASALQAERDAEDIDLEYRNLLVEQETMLSNPRWVDQGKRTAAYRIESAMERVVEAAKADRGATLVPAVGAHDTPTVPAIPGRPDDNAQAPAPAGAAPAAGTPAAGTPAEGAPVPGTAEAATPATGGTGSAPAEGTPPAEGGAPVNPGQTTPPEAAPAPTTGNTAEGNEQD